MTAQEFDGILQKRILKIESVLSFKSAEYATDGDRLHNFKQAASLLHCHQADALLGMLAKHWVLIMDIVTHAACRDNCFSQSQIDEKIGDAINYLILLEAVLAEQRNKR